MSTAERLRGYLTHYARLYPSAWANAEHHRLNRARIATWPDWCFVPMASAAAVVQGTASRAPGLIPPEVRGYDTAVLGALVPWRLGQGVYRFDPDLLAALWDTPLTGDIPGELLYRLPEYGLYVEAPAGVMHGRRPVLGFFAHLEWDAGSHHAELRLLLDTGDAGRMVPLPLHLGGTLEEGFAEAVRQTTTFLGPREAPGLEMTEGEIQGSARLLAQTAAPAVSCLLYLCSENAEYSGKARPTRPTGKKTGRPPQQAQVWEVGVRMGSALRRARAVAESEEAPVAEGVELGGQAGRSVRPHLRRAHWHTFVSGPRTGPQQRTLRWLPPIPVKFEDGDDRPVVVHPVKSL